MRHAIQLRFEPETLLAIMHKPRTVKVHRRPEGLPEDCHVLRFWIGDSGYLFMLAEHPSFPEMADGSVALTYCVTAE